MNSDDEQQTRQYLLARFWEAALGFWRKGGGRTAWVLTFMVIAIALVNLVLQYRLNVWHRVMFDALDKRDGSGLLYQTLIFFPLIAALVGVAAAATYAKMTLQRRWRDWLNAHVLDHWLTGGRYYQLNLVPGDHTNPEYRVAEDLRMSVDAPVEFLIGVFSAVTSAIVFIGVLWFIGGELTVPLGSTMLRIPGFPGRRRLHLCRAGQRIDGHHCPRLYLGLREQESGGGGLPVHAHAPPGKRREHRDAGREQ